MRAARDDVGLSVARHGVVGQRYVHDADVVQHSMLAHDDEFRLTVACDADLMPSSRTAHDADVVPLSMFAYDDVRQRAARDDDARLKAAFDDNARLRAARDDHARLRAAIDDDANLRAARDDHARLSAAFDDDARLRAARDDDARLRAALDDEAHLKTARVSEAELRIPCIGDVGLRDGREGEAGLKDALDLVYTGSDAMWPCNLADRDARLLSDAGLVVQPEVASLPIPSFNGPLLEDLMLKEEYGCDFLRPVKARQADEISVERQPRLTDGTWSHFDKLTGDPSAKEEKRQQKIKKAKAGKTKKHKAVRDSEVQNELAETR